MGLIGRYIDGLTDEQRDRIVKAQAWSTGKFYWTGGDRCLLGVVADVPHSRMGDWPRDMKDVLHDGVGRGVHIAFDDAVNRFGLERVVRACKLRAGAKVEDLQPVRETVEA